MAYDKSNDPVEISFTVKSKQLFKSSVRSDIICVEENDVLCIICAPTATGKSSRMLKKDKQVNKKRKYYLQCGKRKQIQKLILSRNTLFGCYFQQIRNTLLLSLNLFKFLELNVFFSGFKVDKKIIKSI